MAVIYHPGISHGHTPSGRWEEVQRRPDSSDDWLLPLNQICAQASPRELADMAHSYVGRNGLPLAQRHLEHYRGGRGADLIEDTNIQRLVREDRAIRWAISDRIPRPRRSLLGGSASERRAQGRYFSDHFKVEQAHYTVMDFQFAFGAIDRLDFEVDFWTGEMTVWFQDRYEWHPYYPALYAVHEGDARRHDNCVHAAMVELKAEGAADYWMKGAATMPLDTVLERF